MPLRPVPSSSGSRRGSTRCPVISESCQVKDVVSAEGCDVCEVWELGESATEGKGRGAAARADGSPLVALGMSARRAGEEGRYGGEAGVRRAGRGFSKGGGVAGLMVCVSAKFGGGNGEGVREG